MASTDRVYMNKDNIGEFLKWVLDNTDECEMLTGLNMFKYIWKGDAKYIASFPESIDWFIYYCDDAPRFVIDRLDEKYSAPPKNDIVQELRDLYSASIPAFRRVIRMTPGYQFLEFVDPNWFFNEVDKFEGKS